MSIKKIIIFFLIFSASTWAINLKMINYLYDIGSLSSYGSFCFFDSNHDSTIDLHFLADGRSWIPIYFYTYAPWNCLALKDSILPTASGYVWAVGNFDGDSLTDMIIQNESLTVVESRSVDSFPKNAVWKRAHEQGGGIIHTFVTDLDADNRQDIFFTEGRVFYVFENRGDNFYQQVFRESCVISGIFSGDKTYGDFDLDDKKEIIIGYNYPVIPISAMVYECIGDNQYQKKWEDSTLYYNSYDVFSADDADGDGKPEFMIGWHIYEAGWTFAFRVYESIGNDRYEKIFESDSVRNVRTRRSTAYSDCGDVDSDGRPEIVWAIGDGWYIYKATGNNQFQRIFEAYPRPRGNNHMTTKVYVYDFNGNGYPEIFETGEIETVVTTTETKIWEIEGVRLHQPNGGEVLVPGSQFPITWQKFTPPGADSFTLFVSFNNGLDYRTITTIRQSDDTLYLWQVPDSLSDSCKIMIWAYGPPRPGQQVPRGTAWDFSDSVFAIRQTEVAEDARYRLHDTELKILQNPASSKNLKIQYSVPKTTHVKLAIYNPLGQIEENLVDAEVKAGVYEKTLTKKLQSGVYFAGFQFENKLITKKLVIID